MKKVKYCALTTLPESLKSFVIPSLNNLSMHGYDVSVSCAKDESFRKEMEGKYPYFPLDIARGFHLSKTILSTISLYHFFRKEHFDMIEYGTENVALCASVAGFFAGVPIRIYNHWGARYVGLGGVSRILSIWIERLAALFSTDVRQVSHLNAKMCVKQHLYPAQKVKVLGKGGTIGVDFTKFDCTKKIQYRNGIIEELGIPSDAFVFGFVGRIQSDKGVNELMEAFQELTKKYINVYLILVGAVDEVNPIKKENMEWAHNSEFVKFSGFVTDAYRYMSAFDVMVHPTYREGFGMVLQEAAALKIPIITTDIMGPGEYVKNGVTGVLVPPKDVIALRFNMEELMNSEDRRKLYVENNFNYTLKYFERSVMVEQIIKDREELLLNKNRSEK